MTQSEIIILKIDLLNPVYFSRPDIKSIVISDNFGTDLKSTVLLQVRCDGKIDSMKHAKLGWIGFIDGVTPERFIDRWTVFKYDETSKIQQLTRYLDSGKIVTETEYRLDSQKIASERVIHYDIMKGELVNAGKDYMYNIRDQISEIQIWTKSNKFGHKKTNIIFQRNDKGLIQRKIIHSKIGSKPIVQETEYNYDSLNRVAKSILSHNSETLTKEYHYHDKSNPELQTGTVITGSSVNTIKYRYNDQGDRSKTTNEGAGKTTVMIYDYEYVT